MEDKFVKYSKLYVLIFLLFLSVPVIFGILIASFYGISSIISSRPVDMIFGLVEVVIPSAIFSTAFLIFFKRTKRHPSKIVRGISYFLFVVALAACAYFLVLDIIDFFTIKGQNITDYYAYSLPFLAGNIGGLFVIGLLQAFTTEKEVDWMDRRKQDDTI